MKKSAIAILVIAIVAMLGFVSCKADVEPPAEQVAVKKLPTAFESTTRENLEVITERYVLDWEEGTVAYTKVSSVNGILYSYEGEYNAENGALTINTTLSEKLTVNEDGTVDVCIEGIQRHLAKNESGFYTDGHVRLIATEISDGMNYTLKNNLLSKGKISANGDGTYTLNGSVTFVHEATVSDEMLVIDGTVYTKAL